MFIKDQDSDLKTKKGIFDQIIERVSPIRRKKEAGDAEVSPHLPDGKTFAEFDLSEEILKGIENAGFTRCHPYPGTSPTYHTGRGGYCSSGADWHRKNRRLSHHPLSTSA